MQTLRILQRSVRAITAFALLASAATASAQFSFGNPGTLPSTGGTVSGTYTGPDTIFSTLTFSGDLTELLTATFASEADWDIFFEGGSVLNFDPSEISNFTGTISIQTSVTGLFFLNNGDTVSARSFETVNDGPGQDAQWTGVTFGFEGTPSSFVDAGAFDPGSLSLDTFGSDFDTEIALYSVDGTLIDSNDDRGGTLQSSLSEDLAEGEYLAVVGGFNSTFIDAAAVPGNASGNLSFSIGGTAFNTALGANEFAVFSFTVVPAPGAATVLGLAGFAALSRRR